MQGRRSGKASEFSDELPACVLEIGEAPDKGGLPVGSGTRQRNKRYRSVQLVAC